MIEKNQKCPKCKNKMDEGFLPDWGNGSIYQLTWFPGSPQISKWSKYGLKTLDRKEAIPIITYRCANCGYLESYANQ